METLFRDHGTRDDMSSDSGNAELAATELPAAGSRIYTFPDVLACSKKLARQAPYQDIISFAV